MFSLANIPTDYKPYDIGDHLLDAFNKARYAGPQQEQELLQMQLANQMTQKKMPYVEPKEQSELLQSQLTNQKMQELMPFLAPEARESLKKLQIENQ